MTTDNDNGNSDGRDRARVDEVHSEFEREIDMSPSELSSWRDSEQRAAYGEVKSAGQSLDEPLNDVARLKRTPKSEWRDVDDGFNEVEEAEEAINFVARMSANDSGEPIPGTDPPLSKRDASLLNWGHDPNPERSDFTGDRQR